MKFSAFDEAAMRRALELAQRGLTTTHPNPRVGAVLARDDVIVGEGWHERAGGPHAEPVALGEAGEKARGATAYVTLEPCCHHGRTPPCAEALLAAGVKRVVFAIRDPNPRVNGGGAKLLRDAGVVVEAGLLEKEAADLNAGFLLRMTRGRPFVRLKSAASLDGRTALANGRSQWITGEGARADVQLWRARSAAVLTSADTVIADDPRLDVRIETTRQPLRVVLDRRRRVRKSARILAPPGEVLLIAGPSPAKKRVEAETLGAARIERLTLKRGKLDLERVFARLGEIEINEVLVEAGPRLSGALLAAGLVDEWLLYVAPKLLGRDAKPLATLAGLTKLDSAPEFTLEESVVVGQDVRLRLRPRESARTAVRPIGKKTRKKD